MKRYYIYEKLFYHNKNESEWLVVCQTPPNWMIVNKIGMQILKTLPEGRYFYLDEIIKLNRALDESKVRIFLNKLIELEFIVDENYIPVTPNRELRVNGIYIELTSLCNLRCSHCYVGAGDKSSKTVMSKEKILETIYQVKEGGEVGISGGEPLIRDDCMDILEETCKRGYQCTLLTNGLLLDEEKCKKIAQLGATVQVSLEAGTKEIHDEIRGIGSYDKAISAIKLLKKYTDKIRVSFTPTKVNYEEFESLVNLCQDLGVPSIHVCTYTPQGRGSENKEDLFLTGDLLYEFQNKVYNYSKKIDIMGNLPETLDINRVGYLWDKCPLGGSIHIGYDGSIYPCEIAAGKNMIIGNVYKDTLNSALRSHKNSKFVEGSKSRVKELEKCINCEWKHFCGGGCMILSLAEHNSLQEVDYLCENRKKWFSKLLMSK